MLSTQDDDHGQSPSAYADSSGHIAAAWFDYKYGSMCGVTGELLMRISTDNGESWLPESRVTYQQSAHRSSILIVDQEVHSIWEDWRGGCSEGPRIFYSASTDWGGRWQTPERITRGIESSEFSPCLVYSTWNGTAVLHCFIRKYWQPSVCDLFYLRSTEYTSISEWGTGLAENYMMYGNYPNPFNHLTTIKFNTLKNTKAKVSVFDIRGTLIEVLFEGYIESGDHFLTWNAGGLPSGIYFYRIESGSFVETKKMTLIR